MRRAAAVVVLACTMAGSAAPADAGRSAGPRSTAAVCAKRKPPKRARTVAMKHGAARTTTRAKTQATATMHPGRRVKNASRNSCKPRVAGAPPAQPVAGRPAETDAPAAPAPAAEQVAPVGEARPASPSEPPTSPLAVASTLGADAYDVGSFVLRLTRLSVPAGQLTIYFRNHDVSDHDLWLDGPEGDAPERISDAVGESGGAVKKVRVTAGAWRLYCSLPGHGFMQRTLTVT
jgi:hypothetical protein